MHTPTHFLALSLIFRTHRKELQLQQDALSSCQPISPLAYPAHLHLYILRIDSARESYILASI